MGVRFRLLGEIVAETDGHTVELGPTMRRAVLAALLVEANKPVTADALAARVWGPLPSAQVQSTLRSYLSRLRAVLPDGVPIAREGVGYIVRVPTDAVDLHVFRALLRDAEDADDARGTDLRARAFALWRGVPFANIDSPWFADLREELVAARYVARLDDHDARLRLGRHAHLLPELTSMAAAHPLDERLAAQLVEALHRSGRQADAVARYEYVRARLADELGVDPGAALTAVRQRILRPTARAGRRDSLPDAPSGFVGRTDELRTMDDVMRQNGQVVVTGPGGAGKTWFALHWAHRGSFPDGVLHVDLRGSGPCPLTTSEIAGRLLGDLGIGHPPADPDARISLYRDAVADRKTLVVLDDARNADQVEALLPGGPHCSALITSRVRLVSLLTSQGVPSIELGPLPETDARRLLAHHLGPERVAAAPDAVTELVRLCRGMPLALAIMATRGTEQSLHELVAEMRESPVQALDLGDGETSMRAVMASTVSILDPGSRTVLAALAAADVTSFTLASASDLTATPRHVVRRRLRRLQNAHLVLQTGPDEYQWDDLAWLSLRENGPVPVR
jgi:DNA-binding SARP family transcriptional activator